MKLIAYLLVIGLVFALCFLADKGFTRLFRSKKQHRSGLSVRPNRMYAAFGLFLCVLGFSSIVTGVQQGLFLLIAGVAVLLFGGLLVAYYLCMGIYYDADSFLYDPFIRKTVTYAYSDIVEQRLYVITGGSVIVELHMADGRAVSVQSAMPGAVDFLNHAFAAWCRQTDRDPGACAFHDPESYRWFPSGEDA